MDRQRRRNRATTVDWAKTIAEAAEYDKVSYGHPDARRVGIVSHTETRDGELVILTTAGDVVRASDFPWIRGKG